MKRDRLVLKAYGFNPNDNLLKDLLEDFLAFNLDLAEKEKRGNAIASAWIPLQLS